VPLQWATTQNNLGDALSMLGGRMARREPILDALQCFDQVKIFYEQANQTERLPARERRWRAYRTWLVGYSTRRSVTGL
jgi:hypothetical protein